MKRSTLLSVTALLTVTVATAIALFTLSPAPDPKTATGVPREATSAPAGVLDAGQILTAARAISDALPPLPDHLTDAMPDITFQTDANGDLIPTLATRNIFDFFLSALEDEPLEQVLARLERTLSSHLEEPALTQARDLLERYLSYRIELDALAKQAQPVMTSSGFDVVALQQRQETLEGLRQGRFSGTEAEAFFGLEETQDRHMLEYLRISQDSSLSDNERNRALASLEQQLPQALREVRQRVTRNGEVYRQVNQMRAAGASDAEVFQARTHVLGAEAATRLAELDQQRAQWQQRLDDFLQARNRIRQSGMSVSDQQAAIDDLIASRFTGAEVVRARALSAEL
ncbi:lipase secretion chaperone [Marinobacter zhejiangensis]|uniref:Lipase chaperone n=1 Tax=Marinobacter zhejiangensis TaxID=488535 RepID=A0A1I4Q9Y4_9GAMM|nr:lipase secretion chaperone [Marinobacter zhejiangensis]SFM36898.1 Lipase chaperone LimK [Marinobacter zhejiangensis]